MEDLGRTNSCSVLGVYLDELPLDLGLKLRGGTVLNLC